MASMDWARREPWSWEGVDLFCCVGADDSSPWLGCVLSIKAAMSSRHAILRSTFEVLGS